MFRILKVLSACCGTSSTTKAVILTPPPSNLSEDDAEKQQKEQDESSTAATSTRSGSSQRQGQVQVLQEDEQASAEEGTKSFFSKMQMVESLNDELVAHALTQVTACPDRLFENCPAPTHATTQQNETQSPRLWLGRYRHSGEMLFCRIRSIEVYGSCSVVWEDGTMQMGTALCDLRQPSSLQFSQLLEERLLQAQMEKRRLLLQEQDQQYQPDECTGLLTMKLQNGGNEKKLNDQLQLLAPASSPCSSSLSVSSSSSSRGSKKAARDPLPAATTTTTATSLTSLSIVAPELNGLTVWEAAKIGDLTTCLALIDRGDATPNDLEIMSNFSNISRNNSMNSKQQLQQQGRSPLYWASFCGHVELVRELLARGGVDADGSAYLAVTSREKANDQVDLYFDPDEGIFSDGIDYSSSQLQTAPSSVTVKTTEQDPATDKGNQDTDTGSKKIIKANTMDDRTLIRTMLMTAKATNSKNQDDDSRKQCPKKLYLSLSTLSTACSFRSQASDATQTSAATQTNVAASNNTQQQQQQQQQLVLTTTRVVQSVASLVSIPEACSASSSSSVPSRCPSTVSTSTTNRSSRSSSTRSSSRSSAIQSKATPADNTAECAICLNADQPLSICIPCGHISSCQACLELVQKNHTGCPTCRTRIMAIIPLPS